MNKFFEVTVGVDYKCQEYIRTQSVLASCTAEAVQIVYAAIRDQRQIISSRQMFLIDVVSL